MRPEKAGGWRGDISTGRWGMAGRWAGARWSQVTASIHQVRTEITIGHRRYRLPGRPRTVEIWEPKVALKVSSAVSASR